MKITRREWTSLAAAAALAGRARAQQTEEKEAAPAMIDKPDGGFQFLKGVGPYSSGAVASPGYEVVHAIFRPLPPLWAAFGLIEKHLESIERTPHALCGMELRIPKALSAEGFNEFNEPYIERLKQWETHVEGLNPVARTNVALEVNPVREPSVYGFSYTIPSEYEAKTFVVAGAGELASSSLESIVARGDTSAEGIQKKAEQVLSEMDERLRTMGCGWADVTQSNVYTVHNIHPLMESTILPGLHEANRHGVRWHYARPPVLEIEFEMDLRGVREEIIVQG